MNRKVNSMVYDETFSKCIKNRDNGLIYYCLMVRAFVEILLLTFTLSRILF